MRCRYVRILWIIYLRCASRFRYESLYRIGVCDIHHGRNKNACENRRFLSRWPISTRDFFPPMSNIIRWWKKSRRTVWKQKESFKVFFVDNSNATIYRSRRAMIRIFKIVKIIFICEVRIIIIQDWNIFENTYSVYTTKLHL